ncbi:MAG: hypothetical protein ACJASX_004315 [Limisphaerales bacterium]|jgi:hypothetical protein
MIGVQAGSVDDLAQEAFMGAFRELDRFDSSEDFGTWLRGIARLQEFPAEAARFNDLVDIGKKERNARKSRFAKWTQRSAAVRTDKRLIAYYDFESDKTRERSPLGTDLDGAIVGATWA